MPVGMRWFWMSREDNSEASPSFDTEAEAQAYMDKRVSECKLEYIS